MERRRTAPESDGEQHPSEMERRRTTPDRDRKTQNNTRVRWRDKEQHPSQMERHNTPSEMERRRTTPRVRYEMERRGTTPWSDGECRCWQDVRSPLTFQSEGRNWKTTAYLLKGTSVGLQGSRWNGVHCTQLCTSTDIKTCKGLGWEEGARETKQETNRQMQ